MKIILHKKKLMKFAHNKKNLGFVPTMGGLHPGHISLIKRSIKECKNTIVSIFINKQQFNRKRDFLSYPRILNKDISILKKYKVDILYLPKNKEIYSDGYNKKIKIDKFSDQLCGKFRPGHFKAVSDVIDRFIKIIKPNKIFLGKKDMQQLKILEDFIKKNHPYCKVIGCKTIREKNGIAFSSRNFLLTKDQKKIASKIYTIIKKNKKNLIKNKISISKFKNFINKLGVEKIDYLKILNINKLIKPYKKNTMHKIFIAYYIGNIRLIDNI